MNILNKDWRKMCIAAVDTETTGLKPNEDRLTEIGIVYFVDGKPVESFNRLINPQMKIGAKASSVSGITDAMVKKKKPFSKMKKRLKRMLTSCDLWVAHNEAFDRSFINKEFERCGMSPPNIPVLDTRVIADFVWPAGPNNLDAVVQKLRIIVPTKVLKELNINRRRHRADYDALLCGYALMCFGPKLPSTLGDALVVQKWMYEQWFKYTKLGDNRYIRMLEPMSHQGYK